MDMFDEIIDMHLFKGTKNAEVHNVHAEFLGSQGLEVSSHHDQAMQL